MSGVNFILALLGHESAQTAGSCFIWILSLKMPSDHLLIGIASFQEIMRKNLQDAFLFKSPVTLGDLFESASSDRLSVQAHDDLSYCVALPAALCSGDRTKAKELALFFLKNEFGIQFYLPDYEKKSFKTGPVGCISLHSIFHRPSMFQKPAALLPDSPEEFVLYADRLPIIDLGASIRPLSRKIISCLISTQRGGYPFRFMTGVESLVPEYGKELLTLSARLSLEGFRKLGFMEIYGEALQALAKPGALFKKSQEMRSRLAICFKGEPIGFGIFNAGSEPIPEGAFLGVYEGQITSNTTYGSKDALLIKGLDLLTDDTYLQTSKFAGGYLGLANHSKSGNAREITCFFENAAGKLFFLSCLFATQKILTLEEITWDYGDSYDFGTHTALLFDRYGRETSGVIRDPVTGFELD